MNKRSFVNYLKLSSLTLMLLLMSENYFTLSYAFGENLSLHRTNINIIANKDFIEQLNQGKLYYQNGQYNSAIETWENLLPNFQETGDILNYSLTLRYLASAYFELGNLTQTKQLINTSLNQLNTIEASQAKNQILAQVLTLKGKLELTQGQGENALKTWQEAEVIYNILNNKTGILGSQINQAQAYQSLGMYLNAKNMLIAIREKLQEESDISLKFIGLKNLSNAFYLLGDLKESKIILEEVLTLAQEHNYDLSSINLSLGNIELERSKESENNQFNQIIQQTANYYQTAINQTQDLTVKLKAELNLLALIAQHQDLLNLDPNQLIRDIETQINQLHLSRFAIETKVNLAQRLIELKINNYQLKTVKILADAIQESQQLKDLSSEAYAMGTLGQLYDQEGQKDQALILTEDALKIAQSINDPAIIASLQIQLGKIYQAKGDKTKAITTYESAIQSLQKLRKDLVSANPNLQFSFRENIEPVYRKLVELLLENPSQEHLIKARQVIEDLQIAELDNFFRDACLNKKEIENIDSQSAVFYPIILPNSLAVIVSIPNQPFEYYQTNVKQSEIEQKFKDLKMYLQPFFPNQKHLEISQYIYQLMIQPIEPKLRENKIKTLAFVLDGVMRNVPMSVLYDGEKYLIEKYSIALTPGLQLLEPKSLDQEGLKLLLGALSQGRFGFSDLPAVEIEKEKISDQNPAEILFNEQFTQSNLQSLINQLPYPVVHLATHGQFSSNIDQTFLISYDEKIGVKTLEEMIKGREFNQSNPIEILVLSACQTASGDERAALGLAGIAVRSGARSTLASLWSVSDNSTAQLMVEFYQNLHQPNLNKAEALRQAQLSLLYSTEYKKPYYWASFVLIGNWL